MTDGNEFRKRPIEPDALVQHMDGRQGRVKQLEPLPNGLPGAWVRWFRGGEVEHLALGFIWVTSIEENE